MFHNHFYNSTCYKVDELLFLFFKSYVFPVVECVAFELLFVFDVAVIVIIITIAAINIIKITVIIVVIFIVGSAVIGVFFCCFSFNVTNILC